MKYTVALKDTPHGLLLVVTDSDIMGGKFTEERKVLDLSQKFYEGEEKTKEEIKELCGGARHVHLTGKASVALGVELELVDVDKILYVNSVPHAEVFMER